MIPFEIWVIIIVAGVGATVAMMAKAHGRFASDWFFQGVLLGGFFGAGLISKKPELMMLGMVLSFTGLAGLMVFFKIKQPKRD